MRELRDCAQETLEGLVAHRLRIIIHQQITKCIDLGAQKPGGDPATGLANALRRVKERINEIILKSLSERELHSMQNEMESELRSALIDGTWRAKFKGRDVLRRYCGRNLRGLPYEAFRDAILARMVDAGFQPFGMSKVVAAILGDDAYNVGCKR